MYAAGLEAATVIWVSRLFRDEFRRTFDWLNERTDLGVQFFGVEVGVVQIGDTGPRAPVFEVVSRPNDWQKSIKVTFPHVSTTLDEARQDLFAEILEGVNAQRPAIRVPARSRDSWTTFASGPFGSWSIAQINDGRIRVEAYLDCGDRDRNKTLFDEMRGARAEWEGKVGFDLSFERLDERRACRIAAHHSAIDLSADMDPGQRRQVVDWGVASLLAMIDVLNAHLRERAKELRGQVQLARSSGDDVGVADLAGDAESHWRRPTAQMVAPVDDGEGADGL